MAGSGDEPTNVRRERARKRRWKIEEDMVRRWASDQRVGFWMRITRQQRWDRVCNCCIGRGNECL